MTNLPASPYLGTTVSVSGIVVGVMSSGGIYISEPSGSWDSLVSTAEGMPVFTPQQRTIRPAPSLETSTRL